MFHWNKESFYDISDLQLMLNPDILWQLFEFWTNSCGHTTEFLPR